MIKARCINDGSKPRDIEPQYWIKKGEEYTVLMVYNMVKQEGILGIVIKEIYLESKENPYSCFRMDRFEFKYEDIEDLIQLCKDCAELNDFNVEELLHEQIEMI